MTDSDEVKLLPCRFCGAKAQAVAKLNSVVCSNLHCRAAIRWVAYEPIEAAIAAWNTRPPVVTDEVVERVARAMQRENRPSNDCRNRDQREADEDASLDEYVALANAALEASHHAELVEAVRLALDFIEGAEESIREKLSLGDILRAVLAKIGGGQ